MERKSLPISGVCYTAPFLGKDQPKRVTSNLNVRDEYYYDDAIRLTPEDAKNFIGKPIMIEHGTDKVHGNEKVGTITAMWLDGDNKFRMNAEIFVDTPYNESIYRRIKSGHLSGLSVGYRPEWKDERIGEVEYKVFNEISLVKKPFFEGSQVTVAASAQKSLSDNRKKNNTSFFIAIEAMADTPQTTQPETPQPIPDNKDATELLKTTSELSKTVEQKNKEMEEMRAQLEKFQAQQAEYNALKQAEAQRQEQLRVEKQKEADEHIRKATELYRMDHGPDAVLPQEYINDMRAGFDASINDPTSAQTLSIMASLMATADRLKAENQAKEEELQQAKQKIQMTTQNLGRINASYQEVTKPIDNSEKANDAINASAESKQNSGGIFNLFRPRPSQGEIKVFGLSEEQVIGSITASANRGEEQLDLPTHRHMHLTKNSMRTVAPGLFRHLIVNRDFNGVNVPGFTEKDEKGDPEPVVFY